MLPSLVVQLIRLFVLTDEPDASMTMELLMQDKVSTGLDTSA